MQFRQEGAKPQISYIIQCFFSVLWPPHVKSWLTGKDWCWEGLGAGGEGDDRGWDGWMASLTQWTWVWVHSGSWWWTGRPGVLRFMGLQRIRHDWVTELNWTECKRSNPFFNNFILQLYINLLCTLQSKEGRKSFKEHFLEIKHCTNCLHR